MAVLVTGGAGYIGSHMVALLRRAGRDVVVDDLSSGHIDPILDDVALVVADVADTTTMSGVMDRPARISTSLRSPGRRRKEGLSNVR
jgi:UDP-glucose 4-epimerase